MSTTRAIQETKCRGFITQGAELREAIELDPTTATLFIEYQEMMKKVQNIRCAFAIIGASNEIRCNRAGLSYPKTGRPGTAPCQQVVIYQVK